MQKLFIFLACLLCSLTWASEFYYTPGVSAAAAYYAPLPLPLPPSVARSIAVVPLSYSRIQTAAVPLPTVETYNSVHTPDSFQQQYRSDYKPVAYEIVH